MTTLIERLAQATEGSRELDWAIAYLAGIGNEKERKLYAQIGGRAFDEDAKGISPYGYARGDRTRSEWASGSRGRRGHYEEVVLRACDGPSPLLRCPHYTTSIDAALTLVSGPDWRLAKSKRGATAGIGKGNYVDAATPALALCIAALRARGMGES